MKFRYCFLINLIGLLSYETGHAAASPAKTAAARPPAVVHAIPYAFQPKTAHPLLLLSKTGEDSDTFNGVYPHFLLANALDCFRKRKGSENFDHDGSPCHTANFCPKENLEMAYFIPVSYKALSGTNDLSWVPLDSMNIGMPADFSPALMALFPNRTSKPPFDMTHTVIPNIRKEQDYYLSILRKATAPQPLARAISPAAPITQLPAAAPLPAASVSSPIAARIVSPPSAHASQSPSAAASSASEVKPKTNTKSSLKSYFQNMDRKKRNRIMLISAGVAITAGLTYFGIKALVKRKKN